MRSDSTRSAHRSTSSSRRFPTCSPGRARSGSASRRAACTSSTPRCGVAERDRAAAGAARPIPGREVAGVVDVVGPDADRSWLRAAGRRAPRPGARWVRRAGGHLGGPPLPGARPRLVPGCGGRGRDRPHGVGHRRAGAARSRRRRAGAVGRRWARLAARAGPPSPRGATVVAAARGPRSGRARRTSAWPWSSTTADRAGPTRCATSARDPGLRRSRWRRRPGLRSSCSGPVAGW